MSPPSSLHRIISSHKYEGVNIILYFMILLGPQTSLSVTSYGPGTLTPSPCVSCCAGYFLLTWHKLESCEKMGPQLRDCRNQIVPCAYPWSIFLIDNWCGEAALSAVGNDTPAQVILGRIGEQDETIMGSNKPVAALFLLWSVLQPLPWLPLLTVWSL